MKSLRDPTLRTMHCLAPAGLRSRPRRCGDVPIPLHLDPDHVNFAPQVLGCPVPNAVLALDMELRPAGAGMPPAFRRGRPACCASPRTSGGEPSWAHAFSDSAALSPRQRWSPFHPSPQAGVYPPPRQSGGAPFPSPVTYQVLPPSPEARWYPLLTRPNIQRAGTSPRHGGGLP